MWLAGLSRRVPQTAELNRGSCGCALLYNVAAWLLLYIRSATRLRKVNAESWQEESEWPTARTSLFSRTSWSECMANAHLGHRSVGFMPGDCCTRRRWCLAAENCRKISSHELVYVQRTYAIPMSRTMEDLHVADRWSWQLFGVRHCMMRLTE